MFLKHAASKSLLGLRIGLTSIALFQFVAGASLANAGQGDGPSSETRSPIKHVIVIIGENRSFDHVFATYVPQHGQTVHNLLSEGIIKADGTPGPNFAKAEQSAAVDQAPDAFLLNPDKVSFPSNTLPAPLVGGPKDSYVTGDSLALAQQSENGLPSSYYPDLVSGGTGQTSHTPDPNFQCQFAAGRSVSIDQRHHLYLQLVRRKPGASLLSDVAAARLQLGARYLAKSLRLRLQIVPVGRSDCRSWHQWFGAAVGLQHGIFGYRRDYR
jgi:hypothetical protein